MAMLRSAFRNRVVLASFAVMFSLATVGCERHSASEQYYLVATNINLPYWKTADAGLQSAAALYGVKAELRGPATLDPQGEVDEFEAVIARKPAAQRAHATSTLRLAVACQPASAAS